MEYFDERVIITEESSSYLQAIAEVPELSEELDLTIVGEKLAIR